MMFPHLCAQKLALAILVLFCRSRWESANCSGSLAWQVFKTQCLYRVWVNLNGVRCLLWMETSSECKASIVDYTKWISLSEFQLCELFSQNCIRLPIDCSTVMLGYICLETLQGHKTLLSSPWYLNLGGFASNDWAKYYAVEPLAFDATEEQKQLVIGGEVCFCLIQLT